MNRQSASQTHKQKQTATPAASGLLQRKCACGNHTVAGGECSDCSKKKQFGLQTKLKVNEPGDTYEHEADRIADRVMVELAHHAVSGVLPRIQRFSAHSNRQTDAAPDSVHQALASPGRPLEPQLQQDMEQRFGYDFSRVRVHLGDHAVESAKTMNALAFTVGADVVFASGRYDPVSATGRRLLAHELVHVIQQSEPVTPGGRPMQQRPFAAVPAGSAPTSVQRKPADVGMDRAPVRPGRRRPQFAELAAVSQAEKKRLAILDAAINELGPVFEAIKRHRVNEPTRPFQAQASVAKAMRVLGLQNARIDMDTVEGMGTYTYLFSAFTSLVGNRYSSGFADVQIEDSNQCSQPGLYAIESSGGTGNQEPIIVCPIFFAARPECQAFILMHEYFHKIGLIGHGEISIASGRESARQELERRGHKPGYRVASPSALAAFAWVLATGQDPECAEQSDVIEGWPTNTKGPLV